ncbi:hypothetical protein ABMA28_002612 [Loxostege sticticalis]|uniref:Kazal-like domain-containing protein n=1 Tax=Loxostege sticticalis TaxID=481309 RepID=A0ABD0SXQ5_LOXSC
MIFFFIISLNIVVFLCNQTMGTFHQPVTEANLQGTTSEYIRDCVFNCPKTPEYNPICGTDGVKYYNMGTLRCAQYCGVEIWRRTNGLTSFPRHGGETPPTSKLRAILRISETEHTIGPTRGSNPGPLAQPSL